MNKDDDYAAYVAARQPTLVRTAVLLGCSTHEAEDAYVYRMLVNVLRDSRSRKWRGEIPTEQLPPRHADTDVAESVARGHLVRRALATLSEQHLAVLVLRYFTDLSEAHVSRILGIPAGAVKSRTARALAALSAHADIASLQGERRS